MADIPQAAVIAAAEALKARHAEIAGTVIPYDEPELRADIVAVLEAAAPHISAMADARITELHKLAAAMLASFHRTSDGYRARVGQVQLGRWRIALDWENTGV